MTHILPGVPAARRKHVSPRYRNARLALAAELTTRAAALTHRSDLVVSTVTATAPGAPGVFYPDRAAIEIEARLFEKPAKGRRAPAPPDPKARPVGYGVFLHETAHAAHSRWSPPDGAGAAQVAAAMMLEELRIEAAHVREYGRDRYWLRQAAKTLILTDAVNNPAAGRWAVAHAFGLIAGRLSFHVFTTAEATPVVNAAERILGPGLVADLVTVWLEALAAADDDAHAMMRCGTAWCELLGVDPDGSDPAEQSGPATPEETSAAAAAGQAVTSALKHLAKSLSTEPEPGDGDPGQPGGDRQQVRVVPTDDPAGPVTGRRQPTGTETMQAAQLAHRLTHAGIRERTAVSVASVVPPGRLDLRAALARDAQRAAGSLPTAAPWRRTHRKTAPTPPLRIGIAVDVSGSMSNFTEPVASIAWVLAQAAKHAGLDASSATVAFGGETVTLITRPGQASANVVQFSAESLGHPVAEAIGHLDQILTLSRVGAARVLAVVTDGGWTPEELTTALVRIAALQASGCAVLQLTCPGQRSRPIPGVEQVIIANPSEVGKAIGTAAVGALSAP